MDPLTLVSLVPKNTNDSFWTLVEPFLPLLIIVLGIFLIGFVSGLIPAFQAYRSSLSENLSAKS
jgi:ABC-type antimicrobial peptide transport system permease subunit